MIFKNQMLQRELIITLVTIEEEIHMLILSTHTQQLYPGHALMGHKRHSIEALNHLLGHLN